MPASSLGPWGESGGGKCKPVNWAVGKQVCKLFGQFHSLFIFHLLWGHEAHQHGLVWPWVGSLEITFSGPAGLAEKAVSGEREFLLDLLFSNKCCPRCSLLMPTSPRRLHPTLGASTSHRLPVRPSQPRPSACICPQPMWRATLETPSTQAVQGLGSSSAPHLPLPLVCCLLRGSDRHLKSFLMLPDILVFLDSPLPHP